MRRRLLNILTIGSSLLGVAVGLLGVRSLWHSDGICYDSPSNCWSVWSGHGTLGCWGAWGEALRDVPTFEEGGVPPADDRYGWHLYRGKPYWLTYLDDSHWDPRISLPEFFVGWGRSAPHVRLDGRWVFEVPHWFVGILAATLPAVRLGKRCRARLAEFRRRRAGLCRGCRYDLRATVDRCPECGRLVDRRESAAA